MKVVLTKARKRVLLNDFEDVQKALAANYLPRRNSTVLRLNELARALGVKGVEPGCGRCQFKDASRILRVLNDIETETVMPPKKTKDK